MDDSPYNNKVTLQDGAMISKKDGSCGVCAQLLGGRIVIDGKNFIGTCETTLKGEYHAYISCNITGYYGSEIVE